MPSSEKHPKPSSAKQPTERKRLLLVGQVNSGKSTLFNRLLRQPRSLVSEQAGTTTDTVEKLFELPGVGPVLLVDTPGLADDTPLGMQRQQVTLDAISSADLVLYLLSGEQTLETPVIRSLQEARVPTLPIIARADLPEQQAWLQREEAITKQFAHPPLLLSQEEGLDALIEAIKRELRKLTDEEPSLLGNLCQASNLVLLVMPQDSAAPAGRLILPQVQTIRALLDRGCQALCVTPDTLPTALARLAAPPELIITDSQVFAQVEPQVPEGCRLTSFSILMSAQRGDLERLLEGASAIGALTPSSRILIAEACTHAPEGEDIGTVQLPRLLRRRINPSLVIDHVSGRDFPADLTPYDLVIHCGGCMFNRRMLITRQDLATSQQVPMTNYGLAIAYLTGILDKVSLP